jgi:hypothetical protein
MSKTIRVKIPNIDQKQYEYWIHSWYGCLTWCFHLWSPFSVSLTAKQSDVRNQSGSTQVDTQVEREIYIPPYPYLCTSIIIHWCELMIQPERKTSSFQITIHRGECLHVC